MWSAGIVAKSRVTPLLRPTTMDGPHSAVISRPSRSAKNSADSRLSRAWTIVWFNSPGADYAEPRGERTGGPHASGTGLVPVPIDSLSVRAEKGGH